jgi:glycosyltransferase involved in cell wall biosynthesis
MIDFNQFEELIILTTVYIILAYIPWLIKKNNTKEISVEKKNTKIKIGLLTNELPPIIYGGVSTWVLNFMKMFEDDDKYETVPIFLAYLDPAPKDFPQKYPGIRIINTPEDVYEVFKDIDIVVNNLWIALDTVKQIGHLFPKLPIVSVCHSLIKMEHITNLGSQYTNNFCQQEVTFQYSDFVVLISKAEKKYYESFGYNEYGAVPIVIYNSYKPKYDKVTLDIDYTSDNIGYIGRHVPRKRPELPILAVDKLGKEDINVINMGVDFNKGGNDYWKKLIHKYQQLKVIPFSCDKSKIASFWKQVGANSITGIYEPFGYTMCETLDRRVPAIVQNLDGPAEIINELKEYVFMYEVEQDMDKDIDSFSEAVTKFWNTSPEQRKIMAEKARGALERFKPEVIKEDWKGVLEQCSDPNFLSRRKRDLDDNSTTKVMESDYLPKEKKSITRRMTSFMKKYLLGKKKKLRKD